MYCDKGGNLFKPSFVYSSQLTKTNADKAYSGEQLYQLYLKAWHNKNGWWWSKFGADNFTIQEFLDILWSYELGGIGSDSELVAGSVAALSAKMASRGDNDPGINQFTRPDTIVPGGSQGLDRYAYTNNNPLRYTDPTGHYGVDVHSSLTFNLVWKAAFQVAIEKGYSADKASELAGRLAMRISSADQHVDRTEGEENALNKPKGGFEEAAHHWHTTSQAESELMSTVDGTPEEFGEALHAYQDSFSHWQKLGEPDTPGEIWDRHKTNQFDSFKCVIASKCIDHFDSTQDTAWGWIDAAMERGTENYINWYMYSAIPDRDRRPADPRSPAEIQ